MADGLYLIRGGDAAELAFGVIPVGSVLVDKRKRVWSLNVYGTDEGLKGACGMASKCVRSDNERLFEQSRITPGGRGQSGGEAVSANQSKSAAMPVTDMDATTDGSNCGSLK